MDDQDTIEKIKEQIAVERIIMMNVIGKSMQPLIYEDSKVVVKKITNFEQLRKFDIIIFSQGGKLICHYFWAANNHFGNSKINPTFITRPLNPIIGYDHPTSYSEVIGRVANYKISTAMRFRIYMRTLIKKYLDGV